MQACVILTVQWPMQTAQPRVVAQPVLVGRAGVVMLSFPGFVRRNLLLGYGPLLTTYWTVGDEAASALRYCLDRQEEQTGPRRKEHLGLGTGQGPGDLKTHCQCFCTERWYLFQSFARNI